MGRAEEPDVVTGFRGKGFGKRGRARIYLVARAFPLLLL
jgi:hypothetical protein